MKMLDHRCVVNVKDMLASNNRIFLVLDLMMGGNLRMKILREGYLNETESRFYFQQLFCGIEYLHSMGVTHNNLRCENLLLHPDGQLKITDFSMSSILENEQQPNLSNFTSSSMTAAAADNTENQRQDRKEEMPTPTHTSRLTSDPSVATPMIGMTTNSRYVVSLKVM